MKTITQQKIQPQQSNRSLIQDAFVVLREHLGPEKTLQLWHLCMPPQEEYVKTRHTLFAGMDVATMDREIRKLNRE
jgi:hypothetical protein